MRLLKSSEIKELRESLLEEQEFSCPLCNKKIDLTDAALDHDHDTGLIRGVLCNRCNILEGLIRHKFIRSGVHKRTSIINYLTNLVSYLQKEQFNILHPSEKPKIKKLKKSSYNYLKKIAKQKGYKRKFPEYPKSKRLTVKLEELYNLYYIDPEYYKERN